MRTIGIFCLVALLLFLAWHFDILLQLEGLLDWIESLGGTPRGSYP